MSAWTDHVAKWKDCTLCPLSEQRTNIVLGRGVVPCDVLFIGEAPGQSEDALGEPFRGPAGFIMDDIISRAVPVGITYALGNLVCCFPREAKARGDNEPEYKEIMACRPRLLEFIGIADPRLIVCVGSLSTGYVDMDYTRGRCDIIHPAATFPGRMSRVAAHSAIRHAIVKLQTAIEDMPSRDTVRERKRARRRQRVEQGDNIPF